MYDFLNEMLIKQYGCDLTSKINSGYIKKKTTFRINRCKTNISYIKKFLDDNKIKYENVKYFLDAFIILSDVDITKLDIYKDGLIYLQNLSSMIPVLVLDPKGEEHILDMSASPGGKTTEMSSLTLNNCYITACEKNKIRADRLKYNVLKQGCKRVNVMNIDSLLLDSYFRFDKILLDSPCSGSGTLDSNYNKYFSKDLINKSVNIQEKLLTKAYELIKVGSVIIYSTCSILESENENQIKKLINKYNLEIVPIDKNDFPGITFLPTKIDGVICICPDDVYEGFFVAKLRKVK